MTYNNNSWLFSRRTAIKFLAGVAGGMILHGQNPVVAQSSSQMKMTLGGVTWIGLTPFYIAQEKGFFADENLEVKLQIFGANTDYVSAFLANRIDGCISCVTSEAVVLADKGKDYKIVLVQDNSAGGDGILARNSITSLADFKGKKVAAEQGGVGHFFLLQVLKEVGLTGNDITIINADASTAAAAYQAGNVEIASTYAPFLSQANEAQPDGRIIYDSSKMPTAITDFYTFDSKYIDANPEAVTAFVKAIVKALDFLETNRDEAIAIAAGKLEITPEALAADLEGIELPDLETNLEMLANPNSDLYILKPLNAMAEFLVSQGQIKTVPDMASFIEPKFIR
ncbi:ABC transporter, substrate-binding protein, aliphatic sulfonates family [Xenococcus sp. PCC 7305]|uniref:ABC transporter substrate-binding protein n=1 Tax=Xenococcus sp. PCC 7305 TaxID=102125 RepID=UPI0002ABCB03|nr:ABC transporter substrate-binding protein [Xenococcus sp. PCC 7305]ELS02872.1 ABC transporter, substrate-binding protein, aliphatic sulfonates family [Xenococcus sp. PCC 7305]